MAFLILITAVIILILYRRYFPVTGVQYVHLRNLDLAIIKVIDVRDYNESYKDPIDGAINIPIAYLKRNDQEIPKHDLHLIVSSLIEKNMATRFLRQKGFRVIGFTIIDQKKHLLKENSIEIETNG